MNDRELKFLLNDAIRRRGTAPIKLLYTPKDCGCRAPTIFLN
jgi:hypothetical protein